MAEKAEAYKEANPSDKSQEKQYPDPYSLYRQWFAAAAGGQTWPYGETANHEELAELWKRWFETISETVSGGAGAQNNLAESMSPLWEEMAGELREEMLSEGNLPEDPARRFVRWYQANAERWSEVADQHLRKEEVLESISHFLEAYAGTQEKLRRISEEGSKNLRVPTRSDIARVAKLVVVVEEKVDRIEEAFEEFIHGDSEPATAAAVESLEKRMGQLEGKMDRILNALEKLGAGGDGESPYRANGRGTFFEGSKDGEEG